MMTWTTRATERALDQTVSRATRKARETGEPWAVVDMDRDDSDVGSVIRVVSLAYTTMDEFLAWDGQIICICHPDGDVEY